MRWIFLTLFYSGMFPKAPGTMGSLIAILLGLPILYYFAASNLFLAAALIGVIAVKIIDGYEKEGGIHDNKCIVIDELVGVWIAMAMIGFGIYQSILAFILFRLFDIWKPSIIGRIDKKVKGGLGVVGDDALAGFFAGLLGAILFGALEQAGIDIPVLFDFNAQ
ncbi:phosphatidylglycerophosphatase A [Helicobacter monodelphidis]|uniref:phosphatidylglycerophosphatase A family protein n=1 Tax=Helicobacter sp. 15-1451 TaxID=2004995 RepID=UPI000DCE32F1|nr:phosphatidylglycerophosphatase A [Helicobacter sp. 15-1451]RAX57636.1 phosphatidylglycerophosphatase A [Helicobacter sp. 15-1451]